MTVDPPRRFVIESTATCNLGCIYCPTGCGLIKREPFMSWDLFSRVADQIEPFAGHVYIELFGEPTFHPRLPQMIERVSRFATIDIATNGTLIDRGLAAQIAKCKTISVTVSGLDDVYRKVHREDAFEQGLAGLRYMIEAAPGRISWTWVTVRANEHQLPRAYQLAEELGVTLRPKSAAFGLCTLPVLNELQPLQEKFRRYADTGAIKYDRSRCGEFWHVGYALTDGTVTACGFDYAALWPMGNLYEQDFLEIWNGEKYNQWRRDHKAGRTTQLCRLLCGHHPE